MLGLPFIFLTIARAFLLTGIWCGTLGRFRLFSALAFSSLAWYNFGREALAAGWRLSPPAHRPYLGHAASNAARNVGYAVLL